MKKILMGSVAAFGLMSSLSAGFAESMDDLVAAAKKEGQLTVIEQSGRQEL